MQNSSYLESKILTASPARLHLMLIEGAIRFGRQAQEAFGRDDVPAASGPLLRVIDIIGELLAGVRHSQSELNQKLVRVYLFLFCRVSEAKINSDQTILAEVLELLEFERQTWQMACDKLGTADPAGAARPDLERVLWQSRELATKRNLVPSVTKVVASLAVTLSSG